MYVASGPLRVEGGGGGGAMIILWLCYFYFSAEPQDYKGFYAVSRVCNIFLTLRYQPMMSYVIL